MLEKTILENLILNDEFKDKTYPYLKPEYFKGRDRLVFELITNFVNQYQASPTKEALLIDLANRSDVDEKGFEDAEELINSLVPGNYELDWLVNNTEVFCQERAIYNALYQCTDIIAGKSKLQKGAIPTLLGDALGVSFDSKIGHDYLEDAEERWEYYHDPQNKIPFGIDILDEITRGGVTTKSLSMFQGGVHFGKTMILCNLAANYMMQGEDVLYFTLEMREEEISKRIDANMLDVMLDDIIDIPKDEFLSRINRIKAKTQGKLIVCEFDEGANAIQFEHVIHEMRRKKKRLPRICISDYLGLMSSYRVKLGGSINTYTYYKSVAEELRRLMKKEDMAGFTGMQTNRSGFNDSDPDMTTISESFGVPATMDLQIAIVSDDNLVQMNQVMGKQIKNRFGSMHRNTRFFMGFDRDKQRVFSLEAEASKGISRSVAPVVSVNNASMSSTKTFGDFNGSSEFKFSKRNFAGFE